MNDLAAAADRSRAVPERSGPVHAERGATLPPLIRFQDVGVTFGQRPILESIDLDIAQGEFVCVVGPSGCGKTTLLRLLAGLVRPSSGRVLYDGQQLTGPRRDLAILFQDYTKALLPWRTVYGNVALSREAMKTPRRERRAIVMDLLERVGLADHAEKYPSQLSGGMQQRVQIARCLAQEPAVLLMDEPFGALDAMTRQRLQDEMQQLVAATGTTVFFVTHDLEEAIYLGDRVIGLWPDPGRIARTFEIGLARPRDQLATREDSEFLRLRHALYDFIEGEA